MCNSYPSDPSGFRKRLFTWGTRTTLYKDGLLLKFDSRVCKLFRRLLPHNFRTAPWLMMDWRCRRGPSSGWGSERPVLGVCSGCRSCRGCRLQRPEPSWAARGDDERHRNPDLGVCRPREVCFEWECFVNFIFRSSKQLSLIMWHAIMTVGSIEAITFHKRLKTVLHKMFVAN